MRCVIVKKEKREKKKRFNLFRATLKITNVRSETLEKCYVHIVRKECRQMFVFVFILNIFFLFIVLYYFA